MTVPIITFFNNKGGVGTTSLVYHLAWMYSDLGLRVVAADLDPQANLTAAFVDENRLEEIWEESQQPNTIFRCVQPLIRGIGDIATPQLELIEENLALLVGDLLLSGFEDDFSAEWSGCMDRKERSFRVISAFWRLLQAAGETHQADIILADLGPNLGAINRAALIASDYVIVPLSPDLFSLQGWKNLGPTLRRWREEWNEQLAKNPVSDLGLPTGQMQPLGYIVLQHSVRLDRPVKAYQRWMAGIPHVYREAVLMEEGNSNLLLSEDPYCLALLKHYQSLMPLAQEARKPMFHLKPADGAMGAHLQVVQSAYRDFNQLARKIAVLVQTPINYLT
ncbi:Cobyrinic acid ac-diamide synthase [Planktothrix tepida]|uniref:Cobyrinic acid ac-diamide synthase n=1 Tax=Planktothrix tepida PCC 9214 TaxID=671072 RepID=A0A1J1LUZ8_9CYAN|nr:AAA family ATPase [Planktothrix tepida]CAD5990513.1 Cobyrinic acid ac-diamide synthase [Planktothrix tepida]CUR35409.1 Cobyrinic acid ac-diamide synthase [Planktothrix tepida PCC 9214]